ncbi:daunorubicin resistance protein DrrA family ABC transporter ATP-binding protein [Gordonia neofelifaecis]|uniref:ABC transporter-like protein n=1 Tax=Gordonia neofelifaecis NRRL B-59395 TaxID=644548 RepID=F1YKW5_9ACTN|nr:daunorubicin resistance protein DrrA family ABC transporter ATP-binding protein [Gordonia neofelifaecis]EGD54759.1 ABC transporter-like protein [Gordonia neofelifaecis NRRL B-59395]
MIHARGLAATFVTGKGKNRREVRAVDGVDLDIAEGEVVGFLGPNGAGKTTTLRMLTTLLRPTAGTATVNGFDVATQSVQVRRSIGYVSQAGSTFSQALAGDEVTDHGQLYGMNRRDAVRRGKELFDQLQLEGLWDRMPKNMSGGQRRRLDIAMGLIHDPTLVFLDEPTTGLDPQARANLWEHIAKLRTDRGATVFLTTHYLDEADALSDRIMIIDNGTIVAADTPENLKSQVSGDLLHLEFAAAEPVSRAAAQLESLGATEVSVDGFGVRARLRGSAKVVPGLLRELEAGGNTLEEIEIKRPTLDDVFLTLTGRSLRDAEAGSDDKEGSDEIPA